MAATDQAKQKYLNLLASIGRAGLHSVFPNDFEYYACSLELTNSRDEIVDTLVFPVMPSNIAENETPLNNIKKTSTGVVSLFNPSFTPYSINISGNFGRKLRIMTNNGAALFSAIRTRAVGAPLEGYEGQAFNLEVKTGFGVTKILHKIYRRSFSLDETGNPYRVYFYNLALNTQNLVELKNLNITQDQGSNMIWNYSLAMQAIAPAYSIRQNTKSSVINLLSSSVINQGLDGLMSSYQNSRKQRLNNLKY